jgi:hypothetical protein
MKKRFLIALSALLIFGLVAVAFAYTRVNTAPETSSVSCPMHKDMAAGEHKDSCCNKADCCKDGKCSMGGDCCKDGKCSMGCCKDGKCSMGGACCKDKDSCPMKQKGDSKTTAENAAGESCCKPGAECCKGGGACCKHKS